MTTASQIINAALQDILVRTAESPIEADEAQDSIFYLNNLMAEYDAIGIDLGYTVIDSLGDDITVPVGAIGPIIANLGVALAPQFSAQVTPGLARRAMSGMRTLRRLTRKFPVSRLPSTLPIGSGNYHDSVGRRHFYPDDQPEILGEVSGSIELENESNA